MIKVIYPPESHTNYPPDYVKVFLAGPIQGASNWHERVLNRLTKLNVTNKNILLISPKPLFDRKSDMFILADQIDWETEHLLHADLRAFWLDKEQTHYPERAFAQTTRFELGEWMAKLSWFMFAVRNELAWGPKPSILVGYHKNFSGIEYIKHRFKTDTEIIYEDIFVPDFELFCKRILEFESFGYKIAEGIKKSK